jgi:peroxiredoxin Q/BCP
MMAKVLLTHLTQPKALPGRGAPRPSRGGLRLNPGQDRGFSGSVSYAQAMRPGDPVPDFELPAQDGQPVRLSEELSRGPVVLFFYPRAMTPGCTKESCHFRDLEAEFAAVGASRLGISADPVPRQRQFAEKNGFEFPLLSDPDRIVARQYGVKRPGPLFNRRATFVIGADGLLVAEIRSEVDMATHADQALAALGG